MPAPIVHVGAGVTCTQGGQAQPTAPFPRVTVSGQPVVTLMTPYVVGGGCISDPPCATAQWVVGATRVLAGGAPVITRTSQAVCVPTGHGLQVLATQTRVLAT
jgi:hypothetical protein